MKKIALVCNIRDWAFDISAKVIKKMLKDKFEIDIYYSNDEKYQEDLFLILEDVKNYDIIHFFWRKNLLQFNQKEFIEKVKEKYNNYDEYILYIKSKLSTGVYDHLFLEPENIMLYKSVFNQYVKKYVVSSSKLYHIYMSIASYQNPTMILGDIVDDTLFIPKNLERFELFEAGKKDLVIGWVGNSNWNIKYKDFKGFHTIVEPVLDELIAEGYPIKKYYADKNIKVRANFEMPDYYSEIDVCLCTSMTEGTPRPIMESMLCGVPIITTDVGIATDLFGNLQMNFVLGQRVDVDDDESIKRKLKEKIKEIFDKKYLLKELSKENVINSSKIATEKIIQQYEKYFDEF